MGTTSQLAGCLQRHGPALRTGWPRQLSVSKSTSTVVINGLLCRGLLQELRRGQTNGNGEIGHLPPGGAALKKVVSAENLTRLLAVPPAEPELGTALRGDAPELLRSACTGRFSDASLLPSQVLTWAFGPAYSLVRGRIGSRLGSYLLKLRAVLLSRPPFTPELKLAGPPRRSDRREALRLAAAAALLDLLRELEGRRVRASPAP